MPPSPGRLPPIPDIPPPRHRRPGLGARERGARHVGHRTAGPLKTRPLGRRTRRHSHSARASLHPRPRAGARHLGHARPLHPLGRTRRLRHARSGTPPADTPHRRPRAPSAGPSGGGDSHRRKHERQRRHRDDRPEEHTTENSRETLHRSRITQRSPSPRGHRHPEVTVTQRSPSPRGHRHPEVTVTQRSPSPNRATEVTNGQDPASRTIPTVVHRADTIYAPRRSLFIAPPAWQEWEFLTHLQPEPAAEPPPRVPVAAGRS